MASFGKYSARSPSENYVQHNVAYLNNSGF